MGAIDKFKNLIGLEDEFDDEYEDYEDDEIPASPSAVDVPAGEKNV